ncbi:MAG: sensor histidine kinase [Burkholderiaceae bacterium]
MQLAGRPDKERGETFWKTLHTFCATRVVIAFVLLTYLAFSTTREFWSIDPSLLRRACAAYLLVATGVAVLAVFVQRRFLPQLVGQVMLDIVAISVLYVAAGGSRSGLAILFLFPLAGGAILAPLALALFFVSIVTLVLLLEGGYQLLRWAEDGSTLQAGLYGAAFFIAVFAINRLASRLIKQETLAAERGRNLRMQEALNRLIIADIGDGVLVLARDGRVLAVNPSAERMLGLGGADFADQSGLRLQQIDWLEPVSEAFRRWRDGTATVTPDVYVILRLPGEPAPAPGQAFAVTGERWEPALHLKVRFAAVTLPDVEEDRIVAFLQSVSDIENRAQELKLASMGRLTASIAHEVRNPLSAIAHAAALLKEEAEPHAVSQRLLTIVDDNVERLNRMIEDILNLSRKAQHHGEAIVLAPRLEEIVDEFRGIQGLPAGMVRLEGLGGHAVRFDPLHLREVVVNLLSNAIRYASREPGSIRLRVLREPAGRIELHVQDDGAEISPEVRAHLFEPFYTTSRKGTGLGLYLARELCLNNGAMLDYEYRPDPAEGLAGLAGGRFVISFGAFDLH